MKRVRRLLLRLLASIFVAPWWLFYRLRLFSFETVSKLLCLLPGIGGMWFRRVWYEWTLSSCGRDLHVDFLAAFRSPKAKVGHHVYIGHSCWIGRATIDDDVMLGGHIVVLSGAHHHATDQTDLPMRLQPVELTEVHIGRDVWVGNGAIIAADIAEGSIVGAGSVVTKTFAPYDVIVGVPGRVIRNRRRAAVESTSPDSSDKGS